MKINEVEARSGIPKKNIRFYEEQGLLSPKRNSENGYREYGEEEVQILQRIRLMRKLGVSIEEIRQMLSGTHTVGDGMRRHIISLEREQRNLEQSMSLCREMQNMEMPIAAMDAMEILARMEELEQNGTSFQNRQTQDVRNPYIAPILVSIPISAVMFGLALRGTAMDLNAWVWLGLIVLFLAAESISVKLVSLWFAGGGVAALIAALLGADTALQLILFLIVSAGLLALLRPLAGKYISPQIVPTNVDSVVGSVGYVTSAVDNLAYSGEIKLRALVWTARSASGEIIPEGTWVRVDRVEGVKAIVSPVEADSL